MKLDMKLQKMMKLQKNKGRKLFESKKVNRNDGHVIKYYFQIMF